MLGTPILGSRRKPTRRRGVIRSTIRIDPNGEVKKHRARVAKAADHPAKVLEAIEAEA
jgi:peroxiredoxin